MSDTIKITGAHIHNLKHIDAEIPKGKLTVITGVSGSGKSSLAFDTLYEEGKRRYLMFSNTQFMLDSAPSFESITGLSPTVAVEQRVIRQSNPRSTVGTRTKISAMLAVLFAHHGVRPPEYDGGQPLDMAMFQKNSPKGMCVKCMGTGRIFTVDEDDLFRDKSRPLIHIFGDQQSHIRGRIIRFCEGHGLDPDQPIHSLSEEDFFSYKYGDGITRGFNGVVNFARDFYKWSIGKKNWGTQLTCVHHVICPRCGGSGLGEAASRTTVGGKTIKKLENLYIDDLRAFLRGQPTPGAAENRERSAAYSAAAGPDAERNGGSARLIEEILVKLDCLSDVGLRHLALARPVPTLSGGEVQRLFLASYIIAEMDSIIFIFDEPTIGLHEVEKAKLIDIIQNLVRRGNTAIAVEHDENFMRSADYIVDLGPHAGEYGGERIFQGTYAEFMKCRQSLTAPYLSGAAALPVKRRYQKPAGKMLTLSRCCIHNLRDVTVAIPLGLMVGVAGVSGSGKSSLIADTLVPKLKEVLKNKVVTGENKREERALPHETEADGDTGYFPGGPGPEYAPAALGPRISGTEYIKKCVIIDQRPIGRSRTSCPATYTGVFDRVRALFARASGMDPGMFTVNSIGGCPVCKGDGALHYHVGWGNFIDIECTACGGMGFVEEAMAVTLDGKNIRDILGMSVRTALDYFRDKDKAVYRMLQTLERVGMGYIVLGQKTPTISGGEAQRIKLAAELGKTGAVRDNVYILDEPTTGLSFSDTERLIHLMQELADHGATVIVTEHDPGVLSNCDHIIELGPGGGSDGGYVIAAGTPGELKQCGHSIIGKYLK